MRERKKKRISESETTKDLYHLERKKEREREREREKERERE